MKATTGKRLLKFTAYPAFFLIPYKVDRYLVLTNLCGPDFSAVPLALNSREKTLVLIVAQSYLCALKVLKPLLKYTRYMDGAKARYFRIFRSKSTKTPPLSIHALFFS